MSVSTLFAAICARSLPDSAGAEKKNLATVNTYPLYVFGLLKDAPTVILIETLLGTEGVISPL
jgi:hypothetical protein